MGGLAEALWRIGGLTLLKKRKERLQLLGFLFGHGTEPQGHPHSCAVGSFSVCLISQVAAVGQACSRWSGLPLLCCLC